MGKSKCQEKLLNPKDPDPRNQPRKESSKRRRLREEYPRPLKVDLPKPKFSRVEKPRLLEVSRRKTSPETNTVDTSPKKLPPEEREMDGWLPSRKLEKPLKSKVSAL